MFFPIKSLPLELAIEIIRLAASTDIQANNTQSPVPRYQNAKTLCLVSHEFRALAMPHLLHTVILIDTAAVHKFAMSLEAQIALHARRARLALDYRALVRHVWCTHYLLDAAGEWRVQPGTAALLQDVLRRAHALGCHFNAVFFLSDVLSRPRGARDPLAPGDQGASVSGGAGPEAAEAAAAERGWSCRRLTMAGMGVRWNPITSSRQGLAFLAGLTHLTLWAPNIHHAGAPGGAPHWLASVPLEDMPRLTHLAFALNHVAGATAMEVLVYTCAACAGPDDEVVVRSKQGHLFRQWAASDNPREYGTVVRVDLQNVGAVTPIPDHCFELAFLRAAAAAKVRY